MTYKNAGLTLLMQSAIAASKAITAATNADPGVFTSATHGYNDGDVILLEVNGMKEVNNRLFKVVNKATDTYQLEDLDGATGIDTTSYGVFVSGTAKKITFGTNITGCQEFNMEGGAPKFVDTSDVHSLDDTEEVVGATASRANMTMKWNPADAGQQAMLAAYKTLGSRGFKVSWPDGAYAMFYGTIGYAGNPGGGRGGVTTSPAAVALAGPATFGID